MLWLTAPKTLISFRSGSFFQNRYASCITDTESKLPAKLKQKATGPRPNKTNSDLSSESVYAFFLPRENAVNMTTTLASPSLTPGGSPGTGGSSHSRKESAEESAVSIPITAICFGRLPTERDFICRHPPLSCSKAVTGFFVYGKIRNIAVNPDRTCIICQHSLELRVIC